MDAMIDLEKIEYAFAHGNPEQGGDPGMTLRDYMAATAMQGMMASNGFVTEIGRIDLENIAGCSYEMADIMLKARAE